MKQPNEIYCVITVIRHDPEYRERDSYLFLDRKDAVRCAKSLRGLKKHGSGGQRLFSSVFVLDRRIQDGWPCTNPEFHY